MGKAAVTDFEHRVMDALETVLITSRWQNYPVQPLARDLAPRVAAAITKAIQAVDGCHSCASMNDNAIWHDAEKTALQALRGGATPPAESPGPSGLTPHD